MRGRPGLKPRWNRIVSSRRFSTTSRCGLSRIQQFRGSQQPFSSKPWKLGSAHLESLSLQCPGSIAIGDMHLLLFEGAAHLSSQFIEKLPDGAIIKIAGVLRENLTCENGNRLAMARGFTSRSGIEDLAAGKQPG